MTRRSDTEFRREIPQSDIHADAMRRLHANPAVTQEEAAMNWTNPTEEARKPWKLGARYGILKGERRVLEGDGSTTVEERQSICDSLNRDYANDDALADNARLRDALTNAVKLLEIASNFKGESLYAASVTVEARATLAATKPSGGAS